MPYAPFHDLCPDLASKETRTITVLPGSNIGLPAADYQFTEMYCDEADCDCRRVMFSVFSSATRNLEAVLAWGWESLDFYEKWVGFADRAMAREMQGPILNLASPQTANAPALLRLAQRLLLNDPAFVERLQRHYLLFRQKVDARTRKHTRVEAMPHVKTGKKRQQKGIAKR